MSAKVSERKRKGPTQKNPVRQWVRGPTWRSRKESERAQKFTHRLLRRSS